MLETLHKFSWKSVQCVNNLLFDVFFIDLSHDRGLYLKFVSFKFYPHLGIVETVSYCNWMDIPVILKSAFTETKNYKLLVCQSNNWQDKYEYSDSNKKFYPSLKYVNHTTPAIFFG